jgi:hypothetical protein
MVLKESRREEILLNINKRNSSGETPLHQEVIKGDLELVAFLIEHKAPLNTKDYAGWSPLHEACNHGFFEIAQILIENGADVTVCGCDKVTPLHDAAMNAHLDIVKLLIKSGAKVNALNKQKMTPIDVTSAPDVISYLERKEGKTGLPPKKARSAPKNDVGHFGGVGVATATGNSRQLSVEPRQLSQAHVLSPPKPTPAQLLQQQQNQTDVHDRERQEKQERLQQRLAAQLKAAGQSNQLSSHSSGGGSAVQRKTPLQLARGGNSGGSRSNSGGSSSALASARHPHHSSGSAKRSNSGTSSARASAMAVLYADRPDSTSSAASSNPNTSTTSIAAAAVGATPTSTHDPTTSAPHPFTFGSTSIADNHLAHHSTTSHSGLTSNNRVAAAAAGASAAADLSRSTKATRRNLAPIQPKLAAMQHAVAAVPVSHQRFMVRTREYTETSTRAALSVPTEIPSGVPPGLVTLFREQDTERAALLLSMCREIDTMRMTYERDVSRVYHHTEQCLTGRADLSYFEANKTLEFVMDKDGSYMVDLAGTVAHVRSRHQQAAAEITHRHRCDATTLAAMQMLAWSEKSRATPIVPEVAPPVIELVQ